MAVNRSDDERAAEDAARIARLYALASVEEPPSRLDAEIAAAARRPAAPSPRRSPAPAWWHVWRLPFAVAAVAVVSVSLVSVMMEEGAERLTSVPASAPPPAAERDAADRGQPESEARPTQPEIVAPERRVQSQETMSKKAAAVGGRLDDATSGDARRREGMSAQESQRGAGDYRAGTLQKAPMAEAAPPMRDESSNTVGAAAGPRAKLEREVAPYAASAPQDRAAPAPAAAPAAPAAGKPAAEPRASIGLRGFASESADLARPSPEVARHLAQLENQPPAAWIERITALRKEGRAREADGLLAEFKRRFPYEPLPALPQ